MTAVLSSEQGRTLLLTPASPESILDSREKSFDTTRYSYKLGETQNYGLDVAIGTELDIDESRMSVWIPFCDGNRRDGVGDLLEVGGVSTERHRMNPIALFDHGKHVQLPVGITEDPQTKIYTVSLDPITKVGKANVFFYQGEANLMGMGKDHALFCEQLFDLVAKRYVRAGSIGYQVLRASPLPQDMQKGIPQGMHLFNTLMLEMSVVVLPANQDTARKCLAIPRLCGQPLSPYLVKSLEQYAGEKKVQLGYEPKALSVNDETAGGALVKPPLVSVRTKPKVPPARWKPGKGAIKGIRQKYSRTKSFHRMKKSSDGMGIVHIQAKDLELVQKTATEKGLKFQMLKPSGVNHRIKLIGADSHIEEIAKSYGIPLQIKAKPSPSRKVDSNQRTVRKTSESYQVGYAHGRRGFRNHGPLHENITSQEYDRGYNTGTRHAASTARQASKDLSFFEERIMSDGTKSYFAECPRNTTGHCKPKGTDDDTGTDKDSNELERKPEKVEDRKMNTGSYNPDDPELAEEESTEPFSAQVLRRLHENTSILMEEYDEYMRLLEHDGTKAHLQKILESMAETLDETEALFTEAHTELSPIVGEEAMEGEGAEEDDVNADADTIDDNAVPADSSASEEEEEPTPEEAVEGMKKSGKSLRPVYASKDLRSKYKSMCKKCGKKGCSCGKKAMDSPTVPGNEEHQEKPGEEVDSMAPDTDLGNEEFQLQDHELGHVQEAHGFLDELTKTHDFGEEHRMKSYHYHKTLDAISKIREMAQEANVQMGGGEPGDMGQKADLSSDEHYRRGRREAYNKIAKTSNTEYAATHGKQEAANYAAGRYSGEQHAERADTRSKIARSRNKKSVPEGYDNEEQYQGDLDMIEGAEGEAAFDEAERSAPPEHPHMTSVKDASSLFKELSGTRDFTEEHRMKCATCMKSLEPIFAAPPDVNEQLDEEDLESPDTPLDEKSLKSVFMKQSDLVAKQNANLDALNKKMEQLLQVS